MVALTHHYSTVKVKTNSKFHPLKTTVCLAAISHKPELAKHNVAKMRTLKSMRSSLAGIPIVSMEWILSCIEQNTVVNPQSKHCIQTLQTKVSGWMRIEKDRSSKAVGGVLHIAAKMRKLQLLAISNKPTLSFKILRNVVVLTCGVWKRGYGPKLNDVEVLIRDSGGQLVDNVTNFAKLLSSSKTSKSFLIICDESESDEESGITQFLTRHIVNGPGQSKSIINRIRVVNSSFLFDCISCGELLGAEEYPPKSKIGKKLWRASLEITE